MTKKIKLLNIMSLFQNSLLFKLKDAFSLVSLALTTVLFYSTANFAADTVEVTEAEPLKIYDVEIIVFKNSSVPMGRELNLPTPSPSRTELTLDLLNPDNDEINAEKGFFTLLPEEARLQDIVQHIKKSSRYKLLIHTGWRQPGLDKENGLPVWIKGGQNFGNGYSSIDQSEPILIEPVLNKPVPEEPVPVESEQKRLTTLESPSSASSEPEKEPGGLYELEGQIIITLSRYLHTQANLVLRKPATILNLIEQSSTPPDQNAAELSAEEDPVDVLADNRLLNYGLNEKRRMRSKRLHYLDNPQFGMLVMITPYEAPEEVTTIEETSPNLEETAKEQDSQ